jgi:hypothetical protein
VILGIDLGKNVCGVVGVDAAGAIVVRKSMRRQTLIDYVAKLPTCAVAMEACCGAHYLGPPIRRTGARDQADVARVCAPLREGAKER